MKTKMILVVLLCLFVIAPVWANPSIHFSSKTGALDSWTLTRAGGVITMTFYNLEVDLSSTGVLDPVIKDIVGLPTMTVTNLIDHGAYYEALLTPAGPLTITSDVDGLTKMAADVGLGGVLYVYTTYNAYAMQKDDLDITSYTPMYSTVIDQFAATEGTPGGFLDLSFTGTDGDIYAFLDSGVDGFVKGNLSGQINGLMVPVPGAILLGSIGVGFVGWLRRRRTL